MTIYTGDILLQQDENDNLDMLFEIGQPDMTNGFETTTILAALGQDWFGNDLVRKDSEKMNSGFPEIIKRANVTDETKNNGTEALKKAFAFFIKDNIAKKIEVTGEILNSYTIQWTVEITALIDVTLKYFINWERGELTSGLVRD